MERLVFCCRFCGQEQFGAAPAEAVDCRWHIRVVIYPTRSEDEIMEEMKKLIAGGVDLAVSIAQREAAGLCPSVMDDIWATVQGGTK